MSPSTIFSGKKQDPVRLEKQLTNSERINIKKEGVRVWAYSHAFYLIALTSILVLILFLFICFTFVHGTDSGVYYNWGLQKC